MCTITLELPDELLAIAEKQGLLTSSALEAYIRKSIAVDAFSSHKPPLTFAEAQQKIRALGVDLSVDRMLRQKHEDLAHELARETRSID